MSTQFFLAMVPPTVTAQMHKVAVVGGKPRFYDPREVQEARAKLAAHLASYRPETPHEGALRLVCKWCWPASGKRENGQYKTTKPDTDNLQKMLKDVMTDLGFWQDDAQVASEIVEKFWSDTSGIWIAIEEIK